MGVCWERSTRVLRIGIGVLAIVAATGWTTGAVAGGQDRPVAYDAAASADGVRVSVTLEPSILVPELVDLGAPTAQAVADSLGNSSGFAAAPFPGDLLLRGPALLLPTVGLPPDFLPPFPVVVESEHPVVPNHELDVAAYQLKTTSSEGASRASASLGALLGADIRLGAVVSEADAIVEDDGAVVARSSTSVEGLGLGGLSIARIESSAQVRARSADDVEVEGGFAIHLVTAAGIDVAIDSQGVVLGSQRVPLPLLDLLPLESLLAVEGLHVELLPETREAGAIRSGGLLVRLTTVLADGIPRVLPAGTVVTTELVLGRASASAGASQRRPTAPTSPIGPATPPTVVAPPFVPSAVAPTAAIPAAPSLPEQPTPATSITTTASTTLARWSVAGVFPVLALAALGVLGAGRTFRLRGDDQ